ncbi:DDHD domain-containing protein [Lineolata rhizophorae]|uniref:DDHD domain-containing protein n=1 Tax=Lineolata rhizophorae TaxID=578093 RepID=A0A6A6PC72_9PEZI|nr:DDHD domain-containing protein [Lineolata rhizophorae]
MVEPASGPAQRAASESLQTSRYIREVLHAPERPPPATVRYFYTSPLPIDDPLSPLPPPQHASAAATARRHPPRPFSKYDNDALEAKWLRLRTRLLEYEELGGEKNTARPHASSISGRRSTVGRRRRDSTADRTSRRASQLMETTTLTDSPSERPREEEDLASAPPFSLSPRGLDPAELVEPSTTGTPFIRAPSRTRLAQLRRQSPPPSPRSQGSRPSPQPFDSYDWDDAARGPNVRGRNDSEGSRSGFGQAEASSERPSAKVPVGVSRLHSVVMPQLQMEPIYWSPLNDIAPVCRGTWFYKETMYPVEVDVANMLEAGYLSLQPWTETWNDELNSAMEVGALGEMKILHRLWPEKPPKVPESRPSTSRGVDGGLMQTYVSLDEITPERERELAAEHAEDLIDISTGPDGPDNKASGSNPYGKDGRVRAYLHAGVIYANATDAYILRPNLQPSDYYGRRPLANYIRKGREIGIKVIRGFDQEAWDKQHPPKKGKVAAKAREGVSSAEAGEPLSSRRKSDPSLEVAERPKVTDLVLVIHGIGQKLSERVESFHFTHAINSLRRDVNVALASDNVKIHLRKGMGGIMVLPVNWRLSLSFEDGGYRTEDDNTFNQYSLKDITPDTLPSVRNIVSDVMLDIPYYLSNEHNPKMLRACINEANRIYRLWCANNPGFAEYGRVHLIAHSLGSVMAVDILSNQPTHVPRHLGDPSTPSDKLPTNHFLFDVSSLFVCGSPVGFFLLLKRAQLLPRIDRNKPGVDQALAETARRSPGIAASQGVHGCLAVDNIYNVLNPYDPVAYALNAAVDATYAAALKPALVPSAVAPFFSFPNPFGRSSAASVAPATSATGSASKRPAGPTHLPSTVELETHDFSREERAEARAALLNDNMQIDYYLRAGGGPLTLQYLTMLGAHSSYWVSADFVRFVVVEVGRPAGRLGTLPQLRAVKRKGVVG